MSAWVEWWFGGVLGFVGVDEQAVVEGDLARKPSTEPGGPSVSEGFAMVAKLKVPSS